MLRRAAASSPGPFTPAMRAILQGPRSPPTNENVFPTRIGRSLRLETYGRLLLALARPGRFLQVSDQIGAFLGIGHARVGHVGAGNDFHRIGEEAVERLFVPHDLVALHRIRILEALHASGAPAE